MSEVQKLLKIFVSWEHYNMQIFNQFLVTNPTNGAGVDQLIFYLVRAPLFREICNVLSELHDCYTHGMTNGNGMIWFIFYKMFLLEWIHKLFFSKTRYLHLLNSHFFTKRPNMDLIRCFLKVEYLLPTTPTAYKKSAIIRKVLYVWERITLPYFFRLEPAR